MPAHTALGFFNIGGYEWLIILIIALLLFGRRLPEVMRGLGGGVREFRKGIDGATGDDERPESKPRLEEDRKPNPVEPTRSGESEPAKPAESSDDAKQS